MIYKNKSSESINFLEEALFGKKPEQKFGGRQKEETSKREELKPQPAQKLNNQKAIDTPNGGSFLNASDGIGSTTTGSAFLGQKTNNSIWDSNVLDKLSEQKTGDERIKEAKLSQAKLKEDNKNKEANEIIENSKNVDTRKDSTIIQANINTNNSDCKLPSRNISIFDNGDFERIPDKTAGEKAVEEAKNAKSQKKDKTSVYNKVQKSSSLMDDFYNKLTGNK